MMKKFTVKCTCVHDMSIDAMDKNEAVMKMKAMMTQAALDDHFAKYHKSDEPKPTLPMAHAHIDSDIFEDMQAAATM